MNVRLPEDLHEAMRKLAAENRRSLHSEILVALEQYVKRQQDETTRKTLFPRRKEE